MKKKFVVILLIGLLLVGILGTAGAAGDQSQSDKKAITETTPQVQKWGEATLIIKDDKGNVISTRTEKYPIIDQPIKATAVDFDNCWNFCKKVCDGYGVCWLSCGLHCSPWTR